MRIDEIIASQRPTFSVEFFPPKTEEATEQLFATARSLRELEPDFVSVTYGAGGCTRDGTVEITRALKDELGLETMAHLSCVGESREGIAETLDRIAGGRDRERLRPARRPAPRRRGLRPARGRAGQRRRARRPSSPRGWDFTIGGACFPEVHPEAPDLETDLAYLKTKVESGASFLITQLFFDNQVYFDFVEAARARGIEVPIIAGVIPVASFAQTKRICEPLRRLDPAPARARLRRRRRRRAGRVRARHRLRRPAVRGAARCAGAPGIHFYALNRAPATRAMLGALHAARPWERAAADSVTPGRAL